MTKEQKRSKYRHDPAYRLAQIAKVKQNHERNMNSAVYRELRHCRVMVCNVKDSIEGYRKKIHRLQTRLKYWTFKKEEYELLFGRERAQRKLELLKEKKNEIRSASGD